MRIQFTRWADDNIAVIKEYIREDSPHVAEVFIDKMYLSIATLLDHPKLGRVVPEISNSDIRELIFRNYRIIYQIIDDVLFILAIYHGSKDLSSKKNRPWES